MAPLSTQVAAEGFGRDDLRTVYFDCAQAWLYPEGGRSPGWYAFYRGEETEGDFVRAQRELARLAYEQRMRRDTPPFTVYEWLPADAKGLMKLAINQANIKNRGLNYLKKIILVPYVILS